MSLKRGSGVLDDAGPRQETPGSSIFESSSIVDRASRFIAVFSPDIPPKTLQAYDAYKTASHRILAWRKPSKQQTLGSVSSSKVPAKVIYDTGSDEDGEQYAGKKLEKLLIEMSVVGAVVVARWYGGTLLGPVRFDHISNVAKEAIQNWQASARTQQSSKKIKVDTPVAITPEQEADQRMRLAKQLTDRDNNITVLRELLAEKKTDVTQATGSQPLPKPAESSQPAQPSKPDYASMPLVKLKQLEKARDTTISWILKQIDEAEASLSKEPEELNHEAATEK